MAELGSEPRQATHHTTLPVPVLPKQMLSFRELMPTQGWEKAQPGCDPNALTPNVRPPLNSCPSPSIVQHPADLLPPLQAQRKAAPPNFSPPSNPWEKALTGITRSRQILKFFLWFGFSFLSENLVSPINSLWPNLSSSQTEILRPTEEVGREESTYMSSYYVPRAACDRCWQAVCIRTFQFPIY